MADRSTDRRLWPTVLRMVPFVAVTMMGLASANAQEGAAGITQRTVFPAFDPNAPACNAPPGLAKVLAFVQENDRDFLQGVHHGLAMAAKDRDWSIAEPLRTMMPPRPRRRYSRSVASKVGALVATSPTRRSFTTLFKR